MTVGVDARPVAAASGATGAGRPVDGQEPARVDRLIYIVAGALFALLMSLSGRYGFHRDELYFLDCARHLAAGYVDQPVVTPLVARVSLAAFGVSIPGLRLWPALAGAGTTVLAGLLAREFGGGARLSFSPPSVRPPCRHCSAPTTSSGPPPSTCSSGRLWPSSSCGWVGPATRGCGFRPASSSGSAWPTSTTSACSPWPWWWGSWPLAGVVSWPTGGSWPERWWPPPSPSRTSGGRPPTTGRPSR